MGVMVEAGIVKEGTPLCVPSKDVSIYIFFPSVPIRPPGTRTRRSPYRERPRRSIASDEEYEIEPLSVERNCAARKR